MSIQLSGIDYGVIGIYFLLLMVVGFFAKLKTNSSEGYLLGGRKLTLPLFVMTLTSSWYGGILGVGEFTYLYGFSNWVIQGLPYYVFAVVFAFLLARKIRSNQHISLPDQVEAVYGKKAAMLASTWVFFLSSPAPYILMFSVLLQTLSGWSPWFCMLIGLVFSTVYLFKGGFLSDLYTDIFEFVLMYLGFAVLLFFSVKSFGGLGFLKSNLPHLHQTWHGGNSIQFIVVWFFIALWTLVEPSFYQRCAAAKNEKTAFKGILSSIVFWFIFDCMSISTALYAKAAFPDLKNALWTYPILAKNILPAGLVGVFWVAMFAVVMSTLNTTGFISGMSLGKDILGRLTYFKRYSETQLTKLGLIISLLFAASLALYVPSVIQLWYSIASVMVPGLLIPVLGCYYPKLRYPQQTAVYVMLAAPIVSFLSLSIGWWQEFGSYEHYPLGLEPMYPGLILSLGALLILRLSHKQKTN
ncbi:MAG TPA: sodium:solute symporter family protein [Oligoflexia bacterium]|nr:sodium:solute symporter family protein [Oligoflexia bacterium]HMR24744.1 sodium:solute symporter family protein [Oligoflexia bacterium]